MSVTDRSGVKVSDGSGPKSPEPSPPARQFSFTDWSVNNPTTPQPGDRLDSEFDRTNQSIDGLLSWLEVSIATDGSLQAGSVGQDQLVPGLFDWIASDAIEQVQPSVDEAQSYASAAQTSALNAATSASSSATSASVAAGALSGVNSSAASAASSANAAQGYANAAGVSATSAASADNDAQFQANLATDYGVVTQAWAEHMPDTIPPNILAIMGVTGDHWSARWWANEAATETSQGIDEINDAGSFWFNQLPGATTIVKTLLYRATAGQTVFPLTTPDLGGNSWTITASNPEPVEVYVNGVRLPADTPNPGNGDWTLNTATSTLTFLSPLLAGSMVQVGVLSKPLVSTGFVPITGGTMTGPLTLNADPATAFQAATKQYVDTIENLIVGGYLPLTGGTLTGSLILSADPVVSLQAVTKQYADKLLDWIATGATQPRLAQDRSADTYNLKDFDATGGTNYSPALNAAITALSAGTGGKIILPNGRLTCASAIVASIPAGVAITIEGMGVNASELYFSNATDGLSFTLRNSGAAWGMISLKGFTLTRGPASPPMANTGIAIIGDPAVAKQAPGGVYRDLRIQGSAGQSSQWFNSMILNGVSSCTIDSIYILGMNGTATDQGDALLTVTGPTNPHFATSVTIANSILQGGSAGLLITQYVQGVFVSNSTVIGNYDGIRWVGSNSPNYFAEELAVANVSLNAVRRGIYTTWVNQISITGATILRFNVGTPTGGYAGIELNKASLCSVMGNNIIGGNASGDTAGIIVSDCSNATNVVQGNVIGNLHAAPGIHLSGTTVGTVTTGNSVGFASAAVAADMNGNVIQGNSFAGNQQVLNTNQPVAFTSASQTTGNAVRWFVGNDGSTESGGDTGNDFQIVAAHDSGSLIGAPLRIVRQTGMININPITPNGGISFNPYGTSDNHVWMNGPAGSDRLLTYVTTGTGGGIRWYVGVNSNAETGSNTGSDFIIIATNDAGANLSIPLTIKRSSGVVTLASAPTITNLPVNAANDLAAAAAGVPVGGTYRNGSVLMIRVA